MAKTHIHSLEFALRMTSGLLGVAVLAMLIGAGLTAEDGDTTAYLVRKKDVSPWVVLEEPDVMSGTTVPQSANVVFHVPFDGAPIEREVLLGQRGKSVRYWGYCFPQNYNPQKVDARLGFPGLMFLSEQEREIRAEEAAKKVIPFSLANLPTKAETERLQSGAKGNIRHQIEFFQPGSLCYIMSAAPLAIGLDADNDELNDKLENELGLDKTRPDTDGDGILDGVEYLRKTSPTLRDTDSDGILDGIEDKDWDGNIDVDESDPRTKDTDRDGLCDGNCRIRLSNGQEIYAGEDKNLNGARDEGETDPLLWDSEDDGYGDFQRFLKCILDGNDDC